MACIYVGIGSKELPGLYVPRALTALKQLCTDIVRSSIYLSEGIEGATGRFANLVVGASTSMPLVELAANLKAIERTNDRKPGYQSIDLDLLLYDDVIVDDDMLQLPRDDIERYVFVLKPLAELAPALIHPVTGLSIEQMWLQSGMDAGVLTEVALEALEPR